MSKPELAIVKQKSLPKALVAGLIAGLVATAAKTLAERMFPPHAKAEPEPEQPAASSAAPEAIQWGFGAAVGVAYGAIAEYYPAATAKEGASFGMALGALTQEGVLPAEASSAEHEDQPIRERASEMTSHVVYGVVAETVRRFVRKLI